MSEKNKEERVNLKRNFGLATGVSLIVGSIIGSGIFVSPQGVYLGSGSYGLSLIMWAVGGILTLCGSLAYVELGMLIPKSGGAYYYIMEVWGDCAAFVYMFSHVFFIVPGGTAAIALTFSKYILTLFFNDGCGDPPSDIAKLLAVVAIYIACILNVMSAIMSGKIAVLFSSAKIAALVIIIIGGIVKLSQGYGDYLSPGNSFDGDTPTVGGISNALVSAMWAYGGWEVIFSVTEEMKNPERNVPYSIFIAIPLVVVIYLLTNISYFTVVSPEEIRNSFAVAVTWASYVIPNLYWFVPLTVATSTLGTTLTGPLSIARLLFVGAREGHLPVFLYLVHINFYTPAVAVILYCSLSSIFVYLGDIGDLISYTSILGWLFHILNGIGVIVLRYKWPDRTRLYKAPIICPIILILSSLFILLGSIISDPKWGEIMALVVPIIAAGCWVLFVKFTFVIPGTDFVTARLQILFKSIPSELEPEFVLEARAVCFDKEPQLDHHLMDHHNHPSHNDITLTKM